MLVRARGLMWNGERYDESPISGEAITNPSALSKDSAHDGHEKYEDRE